MELKDLQGFVLMIVVVGMLIGVGVIALDNFGTASKELTTISNESFIMPTENETVSLANGDLTTFTRIENASGSTLTSTNYSIDLTAGTINNTDNSVGFENGSTLYAYYVYYEYDTATEDVTTASRTALADISTTWLSLIITIVILSMIMVLVMTSFGKAR